MQKKYIISLKQITILLGVLLLLCFQQLKANQNSKIDSLLTLIKNGKQDTTKIKHLNELAWILKFQNPDTSLLLGKQALEICNSIKLNVNESAKKLILGKTHSNLAVFYDIKGDYTTALDYYLNAKNSFEDINSEYFMNVVYTNMGNLYGKLSDFNNALKYYNKSYEIAKQSHSKPDIARAWGSIGSSYIALKKYNTGLEYLLKSLKLKEEIGNQESIAVALSNIGVAYAEQENYQKALVYFFKAFDINKKTNNLSEIVNALGNIGECYLLLGNYKLAHKYLIESFVISDSLGFKNKTVERYISLAGLYEKSNIALPDTAAEKTLNKEQMRLLSLYYLKKSETIKNEILSEEKRNQLIKKEINNDLEKEKEVTQAQREKELAISEEKSQTQKTISLAVSILLIGLFFISIVVFRSLKTTRKQKQIIEQKSKETELQKHIIEEKNKDITASINYAKRIQSALLREEEHVSKHLPEHFILFIPKDIVSGDFYWGAEKNDYWYFTAADCTGHGVPGAIMSMLGVSFLNDIVLSEEVLSPAEILNQLRERIIKELRQDDANVANKDGMDISLCRLNLKTLDLEWAGANNPLNLIRNGVFEEIKADKQPIGYHAEMNPFTNHKIQLQKGDCIYIYSDGYADQFGGPKGKKFKYKQLEELIIQHHQLAASEQKKIFKQRFVEWKGTLEQVDDVCLFGVRV